MRDRTKAEMSLLTNRRILPPVLLDGAMATGSERRQLIQKRMQERRKKGRA